MEFRFEGEGAVGIFFPQPELHFQVSCIGDCFGQSQAQLLFAGGLSCTVLAVKQEIVMKDFEKTIVWRQESEF